MKTIENKIRLTGLEFNPDLTNKLDRTTMNFFHDVNIKVRDNVKGSVRNGILDEITSNFFV